MTPASIGHLGPPGTFGEQAAIRYDPTRTLVPLPSHAAIVAAVAEGKVEAGIVPIENSLEGAVNDTLDALLRASLGVSSGLLLSGSLFVIVLAYAIRFLTVALSALEAGFERLSPNLDAAARALGETALSALFPPRSAVVPMVR